MDTTKLLLCICIFLCSFGKFTHSISYRLLFPFGEEREDTLLERGDDVSSNEIQLKTPIIFYDQAYSSIYINNNGLLSFESELPIYQPTLVLPTSGYKFIAGFLADIDTTSAGQVFYRESQDQALLQRAALDVQKHFSNFEDYRPTSLFLATWDNVGFYADNDTQLNTFQILIASDGENSFACFHYLDNGINWISGDGKYILQNVQDPPAQAGFDSGEGRLHLKLPHSGTAKVPLLASESNVDVPGVWIYQIGKTNGGNIIGPDLNTGEVTIFEPDETAQTCSEGAQTCHINARCVDYAEGFCCECVDSYYGNGFQCLSPGSPQRLNGKVYGTLNGVSLDNLDMHAYVVTTDGRAYTAISRIPAELGPRLLTLNTVGGIIGWMFALTVGSNARNGYMYTGGDFNRTATIKYQSGETTTVRQKFFGHDALNNLRLETQIDGTVPDVINGVKVTLDDYKEEYRRVSPGVIKSYSTRTYRMNDVAYKYTWEQTINFKECDYDDSNQASTTMRLGVTRNFVVYDDLDQVVRFAMTNKIGVLTGSDPCREGAQDCDVNAECIPSGDTYRCECRPGYTGNGNICADINECTMGSNVCDENASCYNVPGSFQCQCNPGFRGDGRTCVGSPGVVLNVSGSDVQLCGEVTCGQNARCVYNSELQRPQCECRTGFRGDGVTCSPIEFSCNEADICHEDAVCVYDSFEEQYNCQCNEGYSGDGVSCERAAIDQCTNCHPDADCVPDVSRLIYRCQCKAGFSGDGESCTPIDIPDVCSRCDPNARCVEDPNTRQYICRCLQGYQGDGYTCQALDCRVHQICDRNADCVDDPFFGGFRCLCRNGFVGDGRRCEPEGCNIVNNCDPNAQCVPDPRDTTRYMCRCNPGYDGDGQVCIRRVVSCNQVNNCSPNAECVYDPNAQSYRCRCRNGYQGDGYTCRPRGVDCRRDPSLCDPNASCLLNVDTFVCVCNENYRGDGRRCYPTSDEDNYLLVAQGSGIKKIPYSPTSENQAERIIYSPEQLIIALDTDCEEGDLYWTDVYQGQIRKSKLDGSQQSQVVGGLSSPEGLAVDYVAGNLYWTDSGFDIIGVSLLNGTYRKRLIESDLVNPRAIVLDLGRGMMYWTDWNRNNPTIEKAYMDGTNRKVFAQIDANGLPNGLTIDYQTQQICWGDAGVRKIECIRSDGIGRRTVTDEAPYPFSVAFFGNSIYWSDWSIKGISSVNRNGQVSDEQLSIPPGGNGRLYGLTTVHASCPRFTSACMRDNGGCPFLCLTTPGGGRSCACPDDIDQDRCNEIFLSKKKK